LRRFAIASTRPHRRDVPSADQGVEAGIQGGQHYASSTRDGVIGRAAAFRCVAGGKLIGAIGFGRSGSQPNVCRGGARHGKVVHHRARAGPGFTSDRE